MGRLLRHRLSVKTGFFTDGKFNIYGVSCTFFQFPKALHPHIVQSLKGVLKDLADILVMYLRMVNSVYHIMAIHLFMLVIHHPPPFYSHNYMHISKRKTPISQIRAIQFTDFLASDYNILPRASQNMQKMHMSGHLWLDKRKEMSLPINYQLFKSS